MQVNAVGKVIELQKRVRASELWPCNEDEKQLCVQLCRPGRSVDEGGCADLVKPVILVGVVVLEELGAMLRFVSRWAVWSRLGRFVPLEHGP